MNLDAAAARGLAVVVAAGVCVAWYDGHLYQVFDNRITFKRMIYFNKHLMSSGAAISGFRTSDLKDQRA